MASLSRRRFIALNAQLGLTFAGSRLLGANGPANPIELENAKQGSGEWVLQNQARLREIEGFASATSVNRGEQIRLYVSTTDPTYQLEIFRMGWYSGLGGRRVFGPVQRPGVNQPTPSADPLTGLIECNWPDPYTLEIPGDSLDPTNWASGIYMAKLTGIPSGKQGYIVFAVRDDQRPSSLLFQMSVTTYQAYNNWPGDAGGRSLYGFNSSGNNPARKVSFNRPYGQRGGSQDLLLWEYSVVRFLEREGYDVTYATNTDTHRDANLLLSHRGFLSVGHDEYWSMEMRNHVEAGRDGGVSLGFLSANTCYWQVRFEPSVISGEPLRTMVGYKELALSEDPLASDGNPLNDHLLTTRWRDVPVNRPEDALIGVMYTASPVDGDIVVENPGHWVFSRTGLRAGDRLPGLLGYEVDRMFGNAPAGTQRLTHSPFVATDDGEAGFSDMTVYQAGSGATVFATGSIQWGWGLDDFNHEVHGRLANAAAQQITRNVLGRMIHGEPQPRRRTVRR